MLDKLVGEMENLDMQQVNLKDRQKLVELSQETMELTQSVKCVNERQRFEESAKLVRSLENISKLVRSLDKENTSKLVQSANQKEKQVLGQKERKRYASASKRSIYNNTMPQQSKNLLDLATLLSQYEHGDYQQITSGHTSTLSSMPDIVKTRPRKTIHCPSKNNLKTWTVQPTNASDKEAYDLKLRLMNNVCLAVYAHQENESQLSDVSSYYSATYDQFMSIDDMISVGIDSDIQSIDRDVRNVWHKTMTDPSPAYRQQFYAKHTWRYEQNDVSAINPYLPVLSQSSIEADESDIDINAPFPNKRTRKQKNKTNRQLKGKDQIDDSSSEGSHWSIILKRDLNVLMPFK